MKSEKKQRKKLKIQTKVDRKFTNFLKIKQLKIKKLSPKPKILPNDSWYNLLENPNCTCRVYFVPKTEYKKRNSLCWLSGLSLGVNIADVKYKFYQSPLQRFHESTHAHSWSTTRFAKRHYHKRTGLRIFGRADDNTRRYKKGP